MGILGNDTARAWVEVDLGALVANYQTVLRSAKPRVGVLPVVKADAYGLGANAAVRALEPHAPWGYAVATAREGAELRELGVERPVIALFSTHEELELAADRRITPVIGDHASLDRWSTIAARQGEQLPFHLEIDTGMGRAGFAFDEAQRWLPAVLERSSGPLRWEGTLTHFHTPERSPTEEQWLRFERCRESFPPGMGGLVHASASPAALRWPEFSADLVRPGIFLYGGIEGEGGAVPEPVATVKARVLSVRGVPAGRTASYGATFTAESPSRWCTLAIGYGDGLRRELSNNGFARFGDRLAPIIGRVCMDVTVVDVSGVEGIRAGDVAILIGGGAGETSLTDIAGRCGTIDYEILTGLTKRLPRCYVNEGGA